MAFPSQTLQGLTWQNYVSDPKSLVAPVACDFTTYSSVTISPQGSYGQLGQLTADGVVIDNLLNGAAVVCTIGPLVETVPPYTKQTLQLSGTTNNLVITGTGAVVLVTFFYGTFHGSNAGSNFYAAQLAAGLAVQTGIMSLFCGPTTAIPVGYLLCDGSAVSRTVYSNLFAIIGVAFGPGDGATTFNLPDMRGRVPVGAGTGTAPTQTTHAVGSMGGAETVTITATQMPVHTHSVNDPGHGHTFTSKAGSPIGFTVITGPNVTSNWTTNSGAYSNYLSGKFQYYDPSNTDSYNMNIVNASTGITIANAGGSGGTTQPTPVMQPFTTVNYIVKT